MSASAIVTMVIGMLIIWGGLAVTIIWAMRTETSWGDEDD